MMLTVIRLTRDVRAVAAVEFAIIAPVMILLICGLMEFSHVASARTRLEGATMRAARAVAASDCPSERESIMLDIVEGAMSDIPSPNGGVVEVVTKSYANQFGDVGEPEPFNDENGNDVWDVGESFTDVNGNGKHDNDMGSVGSIGGAGQVVSYTAKYKVKSLFEFVSYQVSGTNVYDIAASTVVRNEPIFNTTGCT
jgi:hypothetical protein